MDSQLLSWLALAAAAISNGLTVWNFLQSPARKNEGELASVRKKHDDENHTLRQSIDLLRRETAAEVAKVEDKVDALAARIMSIEGDMRHLPDREVTHRLEVAMAKLDGRIETLDERLKPVAAIGERMQELLIDNANLRAAS
jgi:hypothetical protein